MLPRGRSPADMLLGIVKVVGHNIRQQAIPVDLPNEDVYKRQFLRDLDYGELTGGDWIFDDLATQFVQQEVLDSFTSDFLRMFPNFSKTCPDLWISRSQKAILESPLFYLCLEDNNWSLAVELIQKEPPQGRSYAALQARCYQRYLTGIARCLLNHLPSVGLYTGPWTSGRLRREELSA